MTLGGNRLPIHPMEIAVNLTRIVIPAQMCFFLGSLLMGVQYSSKRFFIPAVGPVIYNVGIIVGGIVGHELPKFFGGEANGYGIAGFAWGALVGVFIGNIVLQVWGMRGLHVRFRPSLNLRFPGVKKCGKLVLPVLMGISLFQADTVINGFYVSHIEGGRAILDNANRLMQLPVGIFGQALGIVILPTLSEHAALKDMVRFKDTVSFGTRLTLFLTIPAAILMVILAQPLIHVVYQHGNFVPANTVATIGALVFYTAGIPAWSAQSVLARAFYARHDTLTPVVIGTSVTVLFFFLNGFLVNTLHMGVGGAALATSISATLHCVLLFWLLGRRVRGLETRSLIKSARRIAISSLLMALATVGIHHLLPSTFRATLAGSCIDLLIAGGIGIAVYLAVQFALEADEITRFLPTIKSAGRKIFRLPVKRSK